MPGLELTKARSSSAWTGKRRVRSFELPRPMTDSRQARSLEDDQRVASPVHLVADQAVNPCQGHQQILERQAWPVAQRHRRAPENADGAAVEERLGRTAYGPERQREQPRVGRECQRSERDRVQEQLERID